jgi:putative ABC transport system substrate-binding protein
MRRREFITFVGGAAATAAWPLGARAQQRAMPVVGFLRSTSQEDSTQLVTAFRQGLKEGGYVEGQSVALAYRWADYQRDRLPALAADLVGRKVAVIVTHQESMPAVKAATTTIPIVFVIGADPVVLGFVPSLARPGGNITGFTFLQHTLEAKRLEVLREIVPRATVLAALVNPSGANAAAQSKDVQDAARTMGVQVHIAHASSERDFEPVFADLAQRRVGGLVVTGNALLTSRRQQIIALAARHAIPTIGSFREYVVDGGLISYGPSQTDAYRQAGTYVGKILKGAKPADLPVQQSSKFDMAINLKTAKALGLELPLSIQMRVSEAIE